MNQDTSTSQNLSSRIIPENNQQNHYKRVIVMITVALLLIVVIVFAALYLSKKIGSGDKALRAQYQAEQIEISKALFENLEKNESPMTSEDKKNTEEFFKTKPSSLTPEDDAALKAFFETSSARSEQEYQQWKAAQKK